MSSTLETRPCKTEPSLCCCDNPRKAGYDVKVGVLLDCRGLL